MLFASWLTVLGVLGAIGWAAHVKDARNAWETAGSGFRLHLDSPRLMPPRLRGRRDGFEIEVFSSKLDIVVQVLDVDPWFTLGKDSAMARSIKPDIETGDPDFDETIRVEGDRDFALGLLSVDARRAVEKVVLTFDGKVEDGKIEVAVGKVEMVPKVLRPMLRLAELLHRPSSRELPARLAQHALEDPARGFRLQAFRQLAQEFYGTDELRNTARLLVGEEHLELRVEAAGILLHSGSEEDRNLGAETLTSLAGRTGGEIWLRRLALERLLRGAPAALTAEFALGMVRRLNTPPELRRSALGALIAVRAVDELLALEPGEYRFLERADVARGLGTCGDPRAQPRLLEFLEYPNEAVRIAAARSVGAVGDLKAVPALRRAAGSRALLKSELARVAGQSVTQIQERAGFAQAGEVALVTVETLVGAVSPAETSVEPSRKTSRGELALLPDAVDGQPADEAEGGSS